MMTVHIRHGLTLVSLLTSLAASACGGDTDEVSVELESGSRCETVVQDFFPFQSMNIAVWGEDESGAACRLGGDRCLDVGEAETIAELEDALRTAEPPLLDVPAEGAIQLAVVAYGSSNCDPQVEFRDEQIAAATACGFGDLAGASDGVLSVSVDCDLRNFRRCGDEMLDPPPCP
jgi:hypothetical protein